MQQPPPLLCLIGALGLLACPALGDPCELYPIALPIGVVTELEPGSLVEDVSRGDGPGQFGWLSWSGSPSAVYLAESLETSRAAEEYVNPLDGEDQTLDAGDWAHGRPGSPNSKRIRDALTNLQNRDIVLPVWDEASGRGKNARYRVAGFARARLLSFDLRGEDRLTIVFLGYSSCSASNLPPVVRAGEDRVVELGAEVVLEGSVEDDGQPALGGLQHLWSFIEGPVQAEPESPEDLVTSVQLPEVGSYAFALLASDGELENADTVVVQVELPNRPPVARDVGADGLEDELLRVEPEVEDPDGDAIAILVEQRPAYGSLRYDGSAFVYEPVADFHGQDQFTYRASDGALESAAAVVSLQVLPVNDAPVADPLDLDLEQGGSLSFELSGADIDSEDLAFEVLQEPRSGTLAVGEKGHVYTPFIEFFGSDSLLYRAFDGELWSEPASVNLEVRQTIFPPQANDDWLAVDEDTALSGSLADWLANDGDVQLDLATVSVEQEPLQGRLDIAEDGSFQYQPDADFHGHDSLVYRVAQAGWVSDPATVNIEVRPVNDAPWAAPQGFSVLEDTTLGGWVEAMDVDGDALSYRVESMPDSGTLVMDTTGHFTYVPEPNFAGMDGFWVLASDPGGEFARFSVSIEVEPVDDPPSAIPSPAALLEDEAGALDLGIVNPDSGDEIGVEFPQTPSKGSLVLQDESYQYLPEENLFGRDRLSFRLSDGISQSDEYEMEIWILPKIDYPTGLEEGDPVELPLGVSGQALTSVAVGPDYLQKDAAFHEGQERLLLAWQGGGMDPEEDSFHFAQRELEGDFAFSFRLDDLYSMGGSEVEGGAMARSSLSPSAAFVGVASTGVEGLVVRYRTQDGMAGASYGVDWLPLPQWLRLTRTGEAVRLFLSEDGIHWRLLDHLEVDLGQQALAGVYCSSHGASEFAFCEASSLEWHSLEADPFRDAYRVADLDQGTEFSDFLYDALGESYRMETMGGSLGESSDAAAMAYVEVEGDFVLTARLAGLWSEDVNGALGLTMRQSLDASSSHFSLIGHADGVTQAVVRAGEGEATTLAGSELGSVPVWLQLERRAGWVIGRYALDGNDWTELGRWADGWQSAAMVGLLAASGAPQQTLWSLVEQVELSEPAAAEDAAFVSQDLPEYLLPGQDSVFRVEFLNTGSVAWTAEDGHRLVWAGETESPWGIVSVALPADVMVEPGQNWVWETAVTAPQADGAYPSTWALSTADGQSFGEPSPVDTVYVTTRPDLLDTDGDGLPDSWEARHFGGLGVDGDADSDGDGSREREEFASGTDPTRPDNPVVGLNVLTPMSR